MSKPLSREARLAAVMTEATERDRARRAEAMARRMKASGGLPITASRSARSGSIVQGRMAYRTAGKR